MATAASAAGNAPAARSEPLKGARSAPLGPALQALAALAPGIAASFSLRHLNLEAKGLSAAGCASLAAAMAARSGGGGGGLHELLLGQNSLGGAGLAALLEGCGGACSSVRLLDLTACGLEGADGVQPLAAALKQGALPSLRVLRVDGNELGAEGAAALAPSLGSSGAARLQQLHMQRCSLGPQGAASLTAALPGGLAVLDMGGNALSCQGGAALAAALAAGAAPQLSSLLLCACGLEDGSIAALAEALGNRGSAEGTEQDAGAAAPGLALDLSRNAAGAAAVAALATAPLSALCLHDCKLGGGGQGSSGAAGSLAPAAPAQQLATPGTFSLLQELDVSGNKLEAAELLPLLEALTATAATGTGEDNSRPCPCLRLLVIAANPGAAEEAVTAAIERLQGVRPGLDVVRRAADTGEGGLMQC